MSTNPTAGPAAQEVTGWRSRLLSTRVRKLIAVALVIVVAAGITVAIANPFSSNSDNSASSIDNAYPTSSARIVERSLSSQTSVSGTLGFSSAVTISLPAGGGNSSVTLAEQTVASATARVAADERALGSARSLAAASGPVTIAAAKAAVTNAKATLATAKAQLASDQQLSCPPASSATVTGAASSAGGQQAGVVLLGHAAAAASAMTAAVTALGSTSATLSGTITPNGSDTSYVFEYGTTSSFGSTTPAQDAGAGTTPVDVTAAVSGLRPDTTYEFTLVATSVAGTVTGTPVAFHTLQSSCVAQQLVVNVDELSLRQAEAVLLADQLNGQSQVVSAAQQLSGDQAALTSANAALALAQTAQMNRGSTFTFVASARTQLKRGSTVYALDNQPVPLFYGGTVLYRALYLGVSDGPDVAELQANLTALGFGSGLVQGPHFSLATETELEAWQRAIGVAATGVFAIGDAVIEPGPLQVASDTAGPGQGAQPGSPVLSATSNRRVVTIALDASQQTEVKVGDPVSITLPSQQTTPGVVTSIGKVAVASNSSNSGGSSATITVIVTPNDPSAVANLNQAPVQVAITNESVQHAFVVPVNALLALASGGYAVEEIAADGTHHLVGVTVGIFDDADGLVQISGSDIAAGERVVVPAA